MGRDLWVSFDVSVKPLKLYVYHSVYMSLVWFVLLLGRKCAAFIIASDGFVAQKKLRTM